MRHGAFLLPLKLHGTNSHNIGLPFFPLPVYCHHLASGTLISRKQFLLAHSLIENEWCRAYKLNNVRFVIWLLRCLVLCVEQQEPLLMWDLLSCDLLGQQISAMNTLSHGKSDTGVNILARNCKFFPQENFQSQKLFLIQSMLLLQGIVFFFPEVW